MALKTLSWFVKDKTIDQSFGRLLPQHAMPLDIHLSNASLDCEIERKTCDAHAESDALISNVMRGDIVV
jgi:hypothetical protein